MGTEAAERLGLIQFHLSTESLTLNCYKPLLRAFSGRFPRPAPALSLVAPRVDPLIENFVVIPARFVGLECDLCSRIEHDFVNCTGQFIQFCVRQNVVELN